MTNRLLTRTALVAALTGGLLAGCSSGDAAGTTTSATAPTTTSPPDTTTASPTSSAPSTTTTLDDESAVRAVHTRFMTELEKVDEQANGPEAILPLAEELTIDPLLARIREGVQRSLDTGERSVGDGYESNIVDVLIEGDRASVLDCSRDTGVLYAADGSVLIQAATTFKIRETRLVRVEGKWIVEEFVVGGGAECDPTA